MRDERPVATDALRTLGTIIDDTESRDAIHLAVEPTLAKVRLRPGEHVGVDGSTDNPVGIVDPFLAGDVLPGERFWLVVYPRTITSLRHVWDHPLFSSVDLPVPTKSASERWMRSWAMEHVSEDYYGDRTKVSEDQAFEFAIRAGYEHNIGPYEDARDYIDDEWWSHWENITGISGDRATYFSCAC